MFLLVIVSHGLIPRLLPSFTACTVCGKRLPHMQAPPPPPPPPPPAYCCTPHATTCSSPALCNKGSLAYCHILYKRLPGSSSAYCHTLHSMQQRLLASSPAFCHELHGMQQASQPPPQLFVMHCTKAPSLLLSLLSHTVQYATKLPASLILSFLSCTARYVTQGSQPPPQLFVMHCTVCNKAPSLLPSFLSCTAWYATSLPASSSASSSAYCHILYSMQQGSQPPPQPIVTYCIVCNKAPSLLLSLLLSLLSHTVQCATKVPGLLPSFLSHTALPSLLLHTCTVQHATKGSHSG